MPILKQKYNYLLEEYSKCSGKNITPEAYIPLLRAALIKECKAAKSVDDFNEKYALLKLAFKPDSIAIPDKKEELDNFIINQFKSVVQTRSEAETEWLTVLILILPEEKSVIANVRGILCSELNSKRGEPVNTKLLETIEAAF
jgi:hypothetical protein